VTESSTETPTVLHVTSATGWRGGERQLALLHDGLARAGVAQVVACPPDSPTARAIAAQGGRVVGLRPRSAFDLRSARRLAQAGLHAGAGLIHAHDAHAHAVAVLAGTLFGLAAPVVVHRRVLFPIGGGLFTGWKWRSRAVRRVLCVSQAVAQVVAPQLRVPELARVVPDGVEPRPAGATDGRLRRALGVPTGVPLVGNVAALTPDKDPATFVAAAARLGAWLPEAHFVLVGEGPLRPALERAIATTGLRGRLHLAGFRDDVAFILPELSLLLFTSASEGFGSTLLDAQLARVPVVATRVGGIPEVVVDGVTGLLADPRDAEGLATAARRLLADGALRARLLDAGERSASGFTADRMVRDTLSVYREVEGRIGAAS